MNNTDIVWDLVDRRKHLYEKLSDDVWAVPEIQYEEYESVALHAKLLREEGFRVSEGYGGIPTAVMGEAGTGGPIIAILGEYDALPNLSQEAGVTHPAPIVKGGHGHGCGHNMLGSASLLAAAAIKEWLEKTGTPGRVRYYGCPAEEGGAAKVFMVRDGYFDDVDIAITWHPSGTTRVDCQNYLASTLIDFTFTGRAAHAASVPHLGRSALDALELMNVGVNFLREHMPSDARIHYAILDGGGIAPNVVQAKATVRYSVRSRDLPQMRELVNRVRKVAEGAAIMTETSVTDHVVSGTSNMLHNTPLKAVMFNNFDRLGPVPFDEADRALAAQFQATLTADDIRVEYGRVGMRPKKDTPLCDFIVPNDPIGDPVTGSTDVGDVSWKVPTIQARVATYAIGTPPHTWQVVAQGKAGAAHKAIAYAAKVMAGTARDLLLDPSLIEKAKSDHRERTEDEPYVSPMPAENGPSIKPPSKEQAA
ncbi:amidohydrolase [Brucella intermedia]|uniref:amidohydrolase n=1 Tax=Brucella intermedia TaxID=94625 RepID=UPI00224B48AD|nr:amidohydrolase [Brucella intermedia]